MSRCRLLTQRGGWRNGHPQDWASRREKSVDFLLAAPVAPTTSAVPTTSAIPTAIGGTPGGEAIGAVDGLLAAGLEWYLSLLPALSTDRREHLPLPTVVPAAGRVPSGGIASPASVSLVRGPAFGAPARLVGEALLCEELLLSNGKDELSVAVAASERLVFHVCHADSQFGLLLGTIRQRD